MTLNVRITRRFEIDYGHRLLNHDGKCRSFHGHRGVFEVTVTASALDEVGRVVDFSVLKGILGGWLDEHWDHAMIVETQDPAVVFLKDDACERGTKFVVLPFPPSAENLAMHFLVVARAALPETLHVESVRMYETPNCWADAS